MRGGGSWMSAGGCKRDEEMGKEAIRNGDDVKEKEREEKEEMGDGIEEDWRRRGIMVGR